MIFSFLSKSVNTQKRPACPRCKRKRLDRQISMFALTGQASQDADIDDLPVDEGAMEKAITALAGEAEGINEDDPRQAAQLMRKLSKLTGMQFGEGMQEALGRLEAGEDPDKIEEEMGDLMDQEDPFILPSRKGGGSSRRTPAPRRDSTLYEM
jgi:hypothetical protein